jgi:hypothetical protein
LDFPMLYKHIKENVLHIVSILGIKNQTMCLLIARTNVTIEGVDMANDQIIDYLSAHAPSLIPDYTATTYQIIVFENFTPGSIFCPFASSAGLIVSTARILAAANHAFASAR